MNIAPLFCPASSVQQCHFCLIVIAADSLWIHCPVATISYAAFRRDGLSESDRRLFRGSRVADRARHESLHPYR